MKESELREVSTCDVCDKKIGASGLPIFWRVRFERLGLKADAIQRQTGLATAMGNAALASVMGPNEDMTELLHERTITVCELCAGKTTSVYMLALPE